jgi:hypothetical protein
MLLLVKSVCPRDVSISKFIAAFFTIAKVRINSSRICVLPHICRKP